MLLTLARLKLPRRACASLNRTSQSFEWLSPFGFLKNLTDELHGCPPCSLSSNFLKWIETN